MTAFRCELLIDPGSEGAGSDPTTRARSRCEQRLTAAGITYTVWMAATTSIIPSTDDTTARLAFCFEFETPDELTEAEITRILNEPGVVRRVS